MGPPPPAPAPRLGFFGACFKGIATPLVVLGLHLFANDTGTNDIWNWKLVDMTEDNTGNTLVTPKGDGAGSRFEGHFAHRGKYDSNDPIMQNYILYADITRTTATTYTLWGRNGDGGAPIYVNYSSNMKGNHTYYF